jgi:hypothetical protein
MLLGKCDLSYLKHSARRERLAAKAISPLALCLYNPVYIITSFLFSGLLFNFIFTLLTCRAVHGTMTTLERISSLMAQLPCARASLRLRCPGYTNLSSKPIIAAPHCGQQDQPNRRARQAHANANNSQRNSDPTPGHTH